MLRTSLTILALTVAGCGGATPTAPVTPGPAAPDPHGIAADEVFITKEPLADEWTSQIETWLAKVEKAPAQKDAEGTFYSVRSSGEMKTKFMWKSRPATNDDMKPGAAVVFFRGAQKDGGFHAPADANASRSGQWQMGHVSDVATLDKGVVKVGHDTVDVADLRVVSAPLRPIVGAHASAAQGPAVRRLSSGRRTRPTAPRSRGRTDTCARRRRGGRR
jgi:hypothetical protein